MYKDNLFVQSLSVKGDHIIKHFNNHVKCRLKWAVKPLMAPYFFNSVSCKRNSPITHCDVILQ